VSSRHKSPSPKTSHKPYDEKEAAGNKGQKYCILLQGQILGNRL